jgi:hypothetical protein
MEQAWANISPASSAKANATKAQHKSEAAVEERRRATKKIGVWVPVIEPSVLHHLWHQRPQRPRGVAAALVVLGCAPPNCLRAPTQHQLHHLARRRLCSASQMALSVASHRSSAQCWSSGSSSSGVIGMRPLSHWMASRPTPLRPLVGPLGWSYIDPGSGYLEKRANLPSTLAHMRELWPLVELFISNENFVLAFYDESKPDTNQYRARVWTKDDTSPAECKANRNPLVDRLST